MRLPRSIPVRTVAGIGLLLISAAVALSARAALSSSGGGGGGGAPGSLAGFPSARPSAHRFDRAKVISRRLGHGQSLVGRARTGSVHLYEKPGQRGGGRVLQGLPVANHHAPLVFLVAGQKRGWVQVFLPVRPDRAKAWVRARELRLAITSYTLEVRLRSHRLIAWRSGRRILDTSIGTGRAVTPTPHGRYFVADLLRPPNRDGFYGPYAFGLSAYSSVLTSFAGGDGQIGIHGTNAPSALGQDVSHGCIRVRNDAITRLARQVPLGSPVTIRS